MHGIADNWMVELFFNALFILTHPMAAVVAVATFVILILSVVVYYLRQDTIEDSGTGN